MNNAATIHSKTLIYKIQHTIPIHEKHLIYTMQQQLNFRKHLIYTIQLQLHFMERFKIQNTTTITIHEKRSI